MGINLYDYGARWYDAAVGRWTSVDPLAEKYAGISPFAYVAANPIAYVDPDGRRFYFAAGAGHDPENTGYIGRMLNIFRRAGIRNPVDIQAHGSKVSDVLFTVSSNRTTPYYSQYITRISGNPTMGPGTIVETSLANPDWRITQAVSKIKADLASNPLENGEQFNLSGYSTGSVTMAQAALMLAEEGQVIDNLVLIGTSIEEDSGLYKSLLNNENIKNVIRVDIPGDNVQDANFETLMSFYNLGDSHPHFKYAFGKKAEENTKQLANYLKEQGVK